MVEHVETVIVGGGQAGLATGYHLAQLSVLSDLGGERADRRFLAHAVGFAAVVHAQVSQWASRVDVPRVAESVPDQR